jgi:hypothetical protein
MHRTVLSDDELADLEGALPFLTPSELAEAEDLLKEDRLTRFWEEMPDDIMYALDYVGAALSLTRGVVPGTCDPMTKGLVFADAEGRVLPYAEWTDDSRLLSGLAWKHCRRPNVYNGPVRDRGKEIALDDVLPLLPESMLARLERAARRGRWPDDDRDMPWWRHPPGHHR